MANVQILPTPPPGTKPSFAQRLKRFLNLEDSTSAKHATGRATTIPYKANGAAKQTLNTSNKPNSKLAPLADEDGKLLQTEQGPSTIEVAQNPQQPHVPIATIVPPITADGDIVDDGTSYTAVTRNPYRVRAPITHRKRLTPAQLRRIEEYTAKMAAGEAAMKRIPNLLSLSPDFLLPDLPWLCGTWHVTHSTLPMWRGKRNVRISYTRLTGDRLDDVVTYQEGALLGEAHKKGGRKNKTIRGTDSAYGVAQGEKGVWQWRGRGLLGLVTSRWEVLAWGGRVIPASEADASKPIIPATGEAANAGEPQIEQWVVTYFAKTLFTPAGIDIYSRRQEGLSPDTLKRLVEGLKKVDEDAVRLNRIQPPGPTSKEGVSLENAGADVQPNTDEAAARSGPGGYGEFSKLVDSLFEVKRDYKDGLLVN